MKLDLVQRVALRYAARALNIPPVKMDSCQHCGGNGIHVDKRHQLKYVCPRCIGTGTEPSSVKSLRDLVGDLDDKYRKDYEAFQKEKKPYRGRSVRQFGTARGRALQTLRLTLTARKEQLDREKERFEAGKRYLMEAASRA